MGVGIGRIADAYPQADYEGRGIRARMKTGNKVDGVDTYLDAVVDFGKIRVLGDSSVKSHMETQLNGWDHSLVASECGGLEGTLSGGRMGREGLSWSSGMWVGKGRHSLRSENFQQLPGSSCEVTLFIHSRSERQTYERELGRKDRRP
ncbi:hypothetical protein GE21DRAFT_1199957 [Neurospora crassa]|nr:hypothetical protein 13E11.120 [imported] - Neurospora crassa [Neurospora crassa]KHE88241.1 hypothetical protein GE21DRAFT_1199957 [Neurospora crassa]